MRSSGYVVETIHDGTDVGIRDAEPTDAADEIFGTHSDATTAAQEMARDFRCRWFDLSMGGDDAAS